MSNWGSRRRLLAVLLTLSLIVMLGGCGNKAEKSEMTTYVMANGLVVGDQQEGQYTRQSCGKTTIYLPKLSGLQDAAMEKALNDLPGVQAVVDLDKGTAAVTSTEPVEDAVLKKAVEDAGYTVKGIQ